MMNDMKKVWIVGAKGHVGHALCKLLDSKKYELFETDIDDVDVTDRKSVGSFMRMTRPDVVINCCGFTDVQECEANPDEAYRVNALGARNLAMAAETWSSKLIQISSDDVFSGKEDIAYTEFDFANPRSMYGESKYAGENLVTGLSTRYVIIRSSWVYGIGRDFVNTVLKNAEAGGVMEVPANQFSTPTSAKSLAAVVKYFIDEDLFGVYHVSGQGKCSRYEFAQTILEYAGLTDKLTLKPVDEKDGVETTYSILDNMMLRLDQIPQPKDWKEELKEFFTVKEPETKKKGRR